MKGYVTTAFGVVGGFIASLFGGVGCCIDNLGDFYGD